MTKAILFNAPKLGGKDVAISHLKSVGIPVVVREAKDKLHELTQAFFCIQPERYWQIYNDRSLKEVPLEDFHVHLNFDEDCELQEILGYWLVEEWEDTHPRLLGNISGSICEVNLSIREAMIYISEIICKPRFGANYFGVARAKSIKEGEIITDGSTGFAEELPPLIDKLGQDNILLLRIHRKGFTYEGDSRNYIEDGVIDNTIDVYNDWDEHTYLNTVEDIVRGFLK